MNLLSFKLVVLKTAKVSLMASVKEKDTTSIHQIHQQQLKSGIKNDEYEHEIVQILGGIDEILTVWFQSNSDDIMTQTEETG